MNEGEILKVGDEVRLHFLDGEISPLRFVAVGFDKDLNYVKLVNQNGGFVYARPIACFKTGRHFPQIEEVLRQMN